MDSFEIFLNHELKIVRATVVGKMKQTDGEKVVTIARKTAAENNYDILYDIRNATIKVAFASWFHLPRNLEVFKDIKTWRIRAAVLASPTDPAVNDYKFYETVTENLGLKLKLFFDETEALNWLTANRPINK